LNEDPIGLSLNGSPGREVAVKIYDGVFLISVRRLTDTDLARYN
jgi:hypothetical protein